MKGIKKTTFLACCVVVGAMALMALGPKQITATPGYTDSPSETNCTTCHTGNPLNQGGGSLTITNNIPSSGYVLGTTYQVTVTVAQPNITLFGFDMEALNTSNTNAGTLTALNGGGAQVLVSTNGRTNVTHTATGGTSTNGSKSFVVNWTAPTTNIGTVTFYAAGNAANADGGTSGDFIYTTTKTTSAAAAILAVAIVGDASVCKGSCALETANVTGGNGTYAYLWSNQKTNATNSVCPTTTTTYTVTVTDANGQTVTASKTVTVKTSTPVTITTSGIACLNNSITLTADTSAATSNTFVWSNGSTNRVVSVQQNGVYTVTVTNANGCTNTGSATVLNAIPITATIAGSPTLCQGASETITANAMPATSAPFTYSWSVSGSSASLNIQTAGTYTATVTNAAGCTATANLTVTTKPKPTPTIAGTTTACGAVKLTAGGGTSYVWSGGNTPNSALNTFFSSGTYAVYVTSANGCTASKTVTATVQQQAACGNQRTIGTDSTDAAAVVMIPYPNPANTYISLQTNLTGVATLNVYNQTGQLVQSLPSVVIANGYTLPISGYANGVYILEVKTDEVHLYRKFVKSE